MTSVTLKGTLPKIGIRPVIDARQAGVRESLEVQTMNMARSVADLIGKELRHSNGKPIECIIPKGTIGRVAEAADCAELFAQKGVAVTITVTPCWCYSSEVIDMDPHTVKAVWGFNGTERPGAVFLAAALAAHSQKGLPAFSIYGRDVKDASDTSIPSDVREKLLRFAKAGLAATTIKGKSYLQIGSQCMGIAGSIVDHDFFQEYLGMRNESVDMTEIVRRVDEGIFDQEEFQKALAWTKEYCVSNEGIDGNVSSKQKSRAQKDADWEYVVKMTLIMRDLMVGNPRLGALGFQEESLGHNAIAAGFQGQRQWTDHWPNGDFSEALLNSSFDWNGVREPFVMATENDTLNGVAMLLGHLLTDTASIFADVRTYWSPEAVERVTGQKLQGDASQGVIHLINSGSASLDGSGQQNENGKPAMKPFWNISDQEVEKCLEATAWFPANRDYFRGGGYSSKFLSKGGMPMTMVRLNLVKGLGPVLQLAEGWTCDLQDEVHRIIDERTDKGWPTTWFAPRLTGKGHFTDVYSVMANWGANHAAVCYGHCGADLITLASMLRIPVCTHNVEEDKIFRPAAWAAFGQDTEASDYRACTTYGPMYK